MMLRRYHKKRQQQATTPKVYTVKELRDMCKKKGLKGYSNKSEQALFDMLKEAGMDVAKHDAS